MPAPQCQCGLKQDLGVITPLIPKGQTSAAHTGFADQVENPLPLLPHFLKGIQQLSWSGQGGG